MSAEISAPIKQSISPMGYIHSTETGAGVDGPGMRFVFFTSGCQFRCLYCHNPDTWKLYHGRQISVAEAVAEVEPYARFLKFAGGVTVSGGEPMMQAEFVGEFFKAIKSELGLHTALDTQGYLHEDLSDEWFDAVDLVMLDIKHSDPDQYEIITGKPLQPTLDFAKRLSRMGKKMWVRYVFVPNLSDGEKDIEKMADFVASLGSAVDRVEVLPFHQLGMDKWKKLGLTYQLTDTPIPSPEATEKAREIFRSRGLKAT